LNGFDLLQIKTGQPSGVGNVNKDSTEILTIIIEARAKEDIIAGLGRSLTIPVIKAAIIIDLDVTRKVAILHQFNLENTTDSTTDAPDRQAIKAHLLSALVNIMAR
jgi:hypothetical protein